MHPAGRSAGGPPPRSPQTHRENVGWSSTAGSAWPRRFHRRQPAAVFSTEAHPGGPIRLDAAHDAPTRRVAVIVNPRTPAYHRVQAAIRQAAAAIGCEAPLIMTTSVADPGLGQARRALVEGVDRVIVAGGDGTIRHVAGVLAGAGVPMAVIPTGSGNVFASNLGLRRSDLSANVHLALTGHTRRVDLGWAQCRTITRPDLPPYPFLCMVGIGWDAQTVADTGPMLKHVLGPLAYLAAGAGHLFGGLRGMSVQLDANPAVDVRAWTLLVGNVPLIPGHVTVFPQARVDDGLLDVLQVTARTPGHWLGTAAKGLLNLDADVAGLHYQQGRRILVRPWQPAPVQVDGDLIGQVTELVVRVQPAALRVVVPGV